jgi:tRNA pseudouridine38-40 synthase
VERRRYALRLAYDGRAFRVFQRQPGLPTVQASLDAALRSLGLGGHLQVAARTDAGVSAVGQVVGFQSRLDLDPVELRQAVNAATPDSILCLAAARAPARFHARASATSRRYVYLIGVAPPAETVPWCWTLPDPRAFPGVAGGLPDAARMREALAGAVGEHDFIGLARPGDQRGSIRTLTGAEVIAASDRPLLAVVVEGRGFLRAMVRNLVGTAVAAGLGLAPTSVIRDLLLRRERYRGVRAPGWGLTLASVSYPPGTLDWR